MRTPTREQADYLRSLRPLVGEVHRQVHRLAPTHSKELGMAPECAHGAAGSEDCPLCTFLRGMDEAVARFDRLAADLDAILTSGPMP